MKYISLLFVILFISVDGSSQHRVLAEMQPGEGRDIEVVQIGPMAEAVGQYNRIEFGLKLPAMLYTKVLSHEKGNGLNPFNPEEILVYAVFYPSDDTSKARRVEGFYYKEYKRDLSRERWRHMRSDYHWRVRFAPDAIGEWTVDFYCVVRDKVYATEGVKFKTDDSENKGFLEKGHSGEISDRYFRFSKTGESFFAIGENLAWAEDIGYLKADHHLTMVQWLKEFAENGGNYARIWLRTQNYGVEHERLGDYTARMKNAWEFDQLLEVAESLGVYLQVNIVTDEFGPEGGWPPENQWKNNPYHKELGLKEPKEFYQDSMAREFMKRRLRYIVSRWGYSTNLAVLEYVTEPETVSNYYGNEADKKEFWEWTKAMNYYVKVILNARQLTLVSFREHKAAEETEFWEYTHLDIASANRYARSYGENWHTKYELVDKIHDDMPGQPYIWSEYGSNTYGTLDYCSDIQFHNTIWAVSFHGGCGTGNYWWWDAAIHKQGYYTNFKPLARFFESVDLIEKNYKARRWDDKMFHYFANLRSFYLVSEDGEGAMGWVQNTDYWWPHLYERNECIKMALDSAHGHHSDPADNSDYAWKIREQDKEPPRMLEGKKMRIKGLNGGQEYMVRWYDTHEDGQLLYEVKAKANMFGTLKVVFPQSEKYPAGDFAFKVVGYTE